MVIKSIAEHSKNTTAGKNGAPGKTGAVSAKKKRKRSGAGEVQHKIQEEDDSNKFRNGRHMRSLVDASLVASLKDCSKQKDLYRGRGLHVYIRDRGLIKKNIVFGNSLISMYAKCGALVNAEGVLDELPSPNVVSYNALIAGFSKYGYAEEAMKHLQSMKYKGIFPNALTFSSVLKACDNIGAARKGEEIYIEIKGNGCLENNSILGTMLVDMYAKGGSLGKAREVFDTLEVRDVVSWTALITGYVRHENCLKALDIFYQMQSEGDLPNATTLSCTLQACSRTRSINQGKELHVRIVKEELIIKDTVLGNALLDMYAKCGRIESARKVLDELPAPDVISWNAMITGYCQCGFFGEALDCFTIMQTENVSPDSVTFILLLKACGKLQSAEKGEELHAKIVKEGLSGNDVAIGNALVDMYSKFSMVTMAQIVFNEIPIRDAVSWNSLIGGYVKNGCGKEALKCLEQMQCEGFLPNNVTFLHALKACGIIQVLRKGKELHAEIVQNKWFGENGILCTSLLDMYAKCGAADNAREVFDSLSVQDTVSWTALITGLVQHDHEEEAINYIERIKQDVSRPDSIISWNALMMVYYHKGNYEQALEQFDNMQSEGMSLDEKMFSCALKACSIIGAMKKGKEIHSEISRLGLLEQYSVLSTSLIYMYCSCGSLGKAHEVFTELPVNSLEAWNTLIGGYCSARHYEEAIACFEQMQHQCVFSTAVTYTNILKACTGLGDIEKGKKAHTVIAANDLLIKNSMVGSSLVYMYVRCGALEQAQQFFDELPYRDIVTWTALIDGYIYHGEEEAALKHFDLMQCECPVLDMVPYICILEACGIRGSVEKGRKIHSELITNGLFGSSLVLDTAVIDMYGKCGALVEGQQVFDQLLVRDIVSWNALINGYAQHGYGQMALQYYECVKYEGLSPDTMTFACALKACGDLSAVNKGSEIHGELIKGDPLGDDIVLGTALVDMYVKCGFLAEAENVLQELPVWDLTSLTTLFAGYVDCGHYLEALEGFEDIQHGDIYLDEVSLICMLKVSGYVGAIGKGKELHTTITKAGFCENNIIIGNALVDSYCKCVAVLPAKEVFDKLIIRDVISWTTLMAGYARLGDYNVVFSTFNEMIKDGIAPNGVTFAVLLNACSNCGIVHQGQVYFNTLSATFGIVPTLDHWIHLLDMFGRAGYLDKGIELIDRMPFADVVPVWFALLRVCYKWGNVKLGQLAFENAVSLNGKHVFLRNKWL